MQFKVSMFPFHSLLQCWEISPLRLLQSWPWWGLCLTLPMLRETCHGFLLHLLFSYSYFSLRDLWWILTLGRPVVDTTYSSDGGDLWWHLLFFTLLFFTLLSLADLWWTPFTLLNWWWRPVVTPTLLYSTLTLFGRPVVYTIYSFELMVETCGEHLLHWWQVYKCSPETPAVGAVRWKGDLTEHLSSVPTEFCSPLSLSSS